MTDTAIEVGVWNHFNTSFGTSEPSVEILPENTARGKDSPEEFVTFEWLPGTSFQQSLGPTSSADKKYRHVALIQITLYVPRNSATGRLGSLYGTAKNLFRPLNLLVGSLVVSSFRVDSAGSFTQGQHYARVLRVSVRWDE